MQWLVHGLGRFRRRDLDVSYILYILLGIDIAIYIYLLKYRIRSHYILDFHIFHVRWRFTGWQGLQMLSE